MDITNLPPRVELAVPQSPGATRQPANAVTGGPETARPVAAPEQAATASAPAPRDREFEPLDVFQVGDNDDLPVPPEPPRQSLALVPLELPEAGTDAAETPPANGETASDGEQSSGDPAPAPGPGSAATPTADAYQAGASEPANPTVDIRR